MFAPVGADEHPTVTTIRAVTASPDQYFNRTVRLTGRFSGRSPWQDAPSILKPLNRSRWDFLLKWDDAAVWVSGLRPVGRDFDLDPLSPADSRTGRWLSVTGTVRLDKRANDKGCRPPARCRRVWIQASDLRLAAPPWGIALQTALQPGVPAPQVVFHDPILDETQVSTTAPVRLQFSRHMAGETFSERVRVSYAGHRSLSAAAIPAFTAVYHDDTRALEIRFTAPLDRYQAVKVELLEGIRAADGRKLEPWCLTFTTGAN
jgi:hypothetical protein